MLIFVLIALFNLISLALMARRIIKPNGISRRGYFMAAGVNLACLIVYSGTLLGFIHVDVLNKNVHNLVLALSAVCVIIAVA